MGYPTKIATCCYCGTRAALVLKGKTRHELACSSCGAPLHDLKRMRKDRVQDDEVVERPTPVDHTRRQMQQRPKVQKKSRKRRKGLFHKVLEEAFDVIEDIFD